MGVVMERGVFEAVPLGLLLPGSPAALVARLRVAGAALDSARPVGDAPTWYWQPEYAAFPGPDTALVPLVLSTSVTVDNRPGDSDWTELELDVCWTRQGRLEVSAHVGVAC
ncbi:hypothetical protein [Streptomyces sp. TLI_171]|uniref:hypothetical protein n=1 Tax=Streptomyces sp. TLI_171 TaxID=1938859 RepID=UPI0016010FA0|nr:hypothetical protein [Streptomyces sp. TLI_171]